MLFLASSTAFTQGSGSYSFKSKNGHEVLPQAGEWSIGVSASSFLQYFGNSLNNTANQVAPSISYANGPSNQIFGNLGGVSFTGKYMASATMAYRVRFQANYTQTTNRGYSLKNTIIPNPLLPEFVEDKQTLNQSAILLGGGIEKRRGSSRLQGIYGAEVLLGFQSQEAAYNYGNAMDLNFNNPATTAFGNLLGGTGLANARPVEESIANRFFAGARGFIGVEYFIAPKISLGAEIGYTIGFQTFGRAIRVDETFDNSALKSVNVERKNYGSSQLYNWGLSLDNTNAGINLNFYF
jgi:hypothetical protein